MGRRGLGRPAARGRRPAGRPAADAAGRAAARRAARRAPARATQSAIELAPLGDDEDAARWWTTCSARRSDDGLARLRDLVAHARRRQPAVRRGDRAQPGRRRRAGARGRALGVRRRRARRRRRAADAATACCCRASTGSARTTRRAAAGSGGARRCIRQRAAAAHRQRRRVRPMRALARLAAADLVRARARPRRTRWRFTHALLHDVVYQNLLLARRTELHERAGRALERAARRAATARRQRLEPAPTGELEALGHHWSLSPDKARGARYLLAAGDWARAVYANDDAIRHYERALRTLTEPPDRRGRRDQAAARRARAAGRPVRPAGPARRCAGALRRRAARGRSGATTPVRAARVLRKIGGLHWEAGERERAGACFSAGLRAPGRRTAMPIERAHLFQEMGRLAFRAGDNATADRRWARARAGRGWRRRRRGRATARAREATVVRAEAFNTLGVALARLGRLAEAVGADRAAASRRPRRTTCCRRPAAATPTSACSMPRSIRSAASRPACAGSRPRRKVGDLGFQSRLYANLAVAYCALDQPLRGRRHRGGAGRRRPRPPARPARPPGRAADRARPDLPVPRRPAARLRVLHAKRCNWPSRSTSRSCSFPATMVWRRCTSTPGAPRRPRPTSPRPRRSASAPASSPTP